MRQVYPGGSALADAALAGLYAYPDPGAPVDVILVGAGTARAEHYGPVRPESEGLRWAWLRDGRTGP